LGRGRRRHGGAVRARVPKKDVTRRIEGAGSLLASRQLPLALLGRNVREVHQGRGLVLGFDLDRLIGRPDRGLEPHAWGALMMCVRCASGRPPTVTSMRFSGPFTSALMPPRDSRGDS